MPTVSEIGYGHHLAAAGNNIAQIVDISGPDIEVNPVKVTNTDSASGFHEYIPGLGDAGTVTANCIYSTAGLTAIYALVRVAQAWTITYADGKVWTAAAGFITKITQGSPLEDRETIDITIKWSGKPTYG